MGFPKFRMTPVPTTPMFSPSLFPCSVLATCLLVSFFFPVPFACFAFTTAINTMHVPKSKGKGSLVTGLELVTIFEAETELWGDGI